MPTFAIWGSDRDLGHADGRFTATRERLSAIHLDGGFGATRERWHRLADQIERCSTGAALYGYSTLLKEFAQELSESGRRLPEGLVRTVWNGAEAVDAQTRALVREVTGCHLHNFYGTRETGAIAVELSPGRRRELVVAGPDVLVEVVDDDGMPTSPGQLGRVLVSLLNSSGSALYRYENGDLAIAGAPGPLGFVTLREISGRLTELIPLANGEHVSSSFFNHALKDFAFIDQFQALVDEEMGNIELRVVTRELNPDLDSLRRVLSRRLADYSIDVRVVQELPRTPNGKLQQVLMKKHLG